MAGLQEYKCPCCGGGVEFNASVQKIKCPYCDTEFELETLKGYDEALNSAQEDDMSWDSVSDQEWTEGETAGMRVFVCRSCGGQIIGDANMGATSCPYCGNPIVMMGAFAGDLKPEYVIPFKLDKEAAKKAYYEHLSGRKLLPRVFKDDNHIEEIKGIYVPFWLFDATSNAQMVYKGTQSRQYRDNQFLYTETSYYQLNRAGSIAFEKVPVDGSTKMDDTLMQSLEPFDFSQAVSFQTAYLAGYLADKYDVSKETCIQTANDRIKTSTQQVFDSTVTEFNNVVAEGRSIRLSQGSAKYALYPVWLLNTEWQGTRYTFAMNGQTGKFVGDLPVDEGAAKRRWWKIFGIASVAAYAVSWLISFFL